MKILAGHLMLKSCHCSLQNVLEYFINYVTEDVLCMVYHSLVYSRLQYGIIIWATGTKTLLQEIRVLQNNIIHILTYNKKFSHVTPLSKKLNLLKFDDIYKLELAKFMYLLEQSSLPSGIFNKFTKIEQVHVIIQDKQVN